MIEQKEDIEFKRKTILTMQRYFRGLMTRKLVKAKYGFQAKHTV